MEIIYHPNSYESGDWAHINDYLCSPDSQSVELGLFLLEKNPKACQEASVGLHLCAQLQPNGHGLRANILLRLHGRKQDGLIAQYLGDLFKIWTAEELDKPLFLRQLQHFEQVEPEYFRRVGENAHFAPAFSKLAESLQQHFEDYERAFLYVEQALRFGDRSMRPRKVWIECLIRYFLPKGQRLELAPALKEELISIYQQYKGFQGLMAMYLGIVCGYHLQDISAGIEWIKKAQSIGLPLPLLKQCEQIALELSQQRP